MKSIDINNYPGSKNGSGVLQWLINNIPYHKYYYELFAGTGALFYGKKVAECSLLNDLNKEVAEYHTGRSDFLIFNGRAKVLCKDALDILGDGIGFSREYFIYLDPPYPKSSRRNGKSYYRHEMLSDADHERLLNAAMKSDANIMISTRQNDLYDRMLAGWRKETFMTSDRGGPVEEIIYMNYPQPLYLHQYDYIGDGFTDRQRLKRKSERFANKVSMLPEYEKHLYIQELIKNERSAVQHFLSIDAGRK